MTDPTPQTIAPASAAEVLLLLASYAEAARIAADPEEPAANNHMARMAEDSLRRRLLALSPAHLRTLAAQPAPAPAERVMLIPAAEFRAFFEALTPLEQADDTFEEYRVSVAAVERLDASVCPGSAPDDAGLREALVLAAIPLEVLHAAERERPLLSPEVNQGIVEAVRAIRAALLAQHPTPAGAGAEAELTERVLDSVRGLLMWYGGGADKTVKSLRFHLENLDGMEGVRVPPDFAEMEPAQHVSKSLIADILWRTMQAAQAQAEGGEVLSDSE